MAAPILIDQGKFSRHLEDVAAVPDIDEINRSWSATSGRRTTAAT